MVKVIGVRFKTAGKVYYFDPDKFKLKTGDSVIVETARGLEFGTVTMEESEVPENEIVSPLKKIIRIANEEDHRKHIENVKKKEKIRYYPIYMISFLQKEEPMEDFIYKPDLSVLM